MTAAFVLGGGGARGDFELGALQYLLHRSIRPDILAATSVGSINAVKLAEATTAATRRAATAGWRRSGSACARTPTCTPRPRGSRPSIRTFAGTSPATRRLRPARRAHDRSGPDSDRHGLRLHAGADAIARRSPDDRVWRTADEIAGLRKQIWRFECLASGQLVATERARGVSPPQPERIPEIVAAKERLHALVEERGALGGELPQDAARWAAEPEAHPVPLNGLLPITVVSRPAPAVAANGSARVEALGLGQDRSAFVKRFDGQQWSPGWSSLGGVFTSSRRLPGGGGIRSVGP